MFGGKHPHGIRTVSARHPRGIWFPVRIFKFEVLPEFRPGRPGGLGRATSRDLLGSGDLARSGFISGNMLELLTPLGAGQGAP